LAWISESLSQVITDWREFRRLVSIGVAFRCFAALCSYLSANHPPLPPYVDPIRPKVTQDNPRFWVSSQRLMAKFSMILYRLHPEALLEYSAFLRSNQLRIRTWP